MSETGKDNDSVSMDEKQQMIKELESLKMYESNMTTDDMRQLLNVVNESKDNANVYNKSINKIAEPTHQDNHMCYAKRLGAKAVDRGSASPELSSSQSRKSFPTEKRAESNDEGIYSPHNRHSMGRENKDSSRSNANKKRASMNDNMFVDTTTTDNKRTNSQMRAHEPVLKHRINPLDALVKSNDVPLHLEKRDLPVKDGGILSSDENFDKKLAQLSNHLQRIAEHWLSQQSASKSAGSWGRAIQMVAVDGSPNRESASEETSELPGTSNKTSFHLDNEENRRPRRKRLFDYTEGDPSGSDSEEDFGLSKKRRSMKRPDSLERTMESLSREIERQRSDISDQEEIEESSKILQVEKNSEEAPKKYTKRIKPTKRGASVEKLIEARVSNEGIKKGKSVSHREETREAVNEEENDEELRKSRKIMKPSRRSASREKSIIPKTTLSNDSRRRTRNSRESGDCKVINEEDFINSEEEENAKAKRKRIAKSGPESKTADNCVGKIETASKNRGQGKEKESVHKDSVAIMISDSDESEEDAESAVQKIWRETQRKQREKRNEEEAGSSSTSSCYPRRIVPPIPGRRCASVGVIKSFQTQSIKRTKQDEAKKSLQAQRIKERKAEDPKKSLQVQSIKERKEDDVIRSSQAQTIKERKGDEVVVRIEKKKSSNCGSSREREKSDEIVKLEQLSEKTRAKSNVVEIKPLRVSGRMKQQLEHLQSLRREEEQEQLQRAAEVRSKEERIRHEKEERLRQRLQEQSRKIKEEERAKRAKAEVESRWKDMMKHQEKKRRSERVELNPEGPKQGAEATVEVVRENRDVELVNDRPRTSSAHPSKRVPCPICGRKFLAVQIEDHAASCEEYGDPSSSGPNRSESPVVATRPSHSNQRRAGSSKLFECIVCSAFSTNDGRKYEDHVNKCITNHRDGGAPGPSAIIEVPDSPIRSLRKASELSDSEINYHGQFAPKAKTNAGKMGRKRRRL